jgi:hypothetical protein
MVSDQLKPLRAKWHKSPGGLDLSLKARYYLSFPNNGLLASSLVNRGPPEDDLQGMDHYFLQQDMHVDLERVTCELKDLTQHIILASNDARNRVYYIDTRYRLRQALQQPGLRAGVVTL